MPLFGEVDPCDLLAASGKRAGDFLSALTAELASLRAAVDDADQRRRRRRAKAAEHAGWLAGVADTRIRRRFWRLLLVRRQEAAEQRRAAGSHSAEDHEGLALQLQVLGEQVEELVSRVDERTRSLTQRQNELAVEQRVQGERAAKRSGLVDERFESLESKIGRAPPSAAAAADSPRVGSSEAASRCDELDRRVARLEHLPTGGDDRERALRLAEEARVQCESLKTLADTQGRRAAELDARVASLERGAAPSSPASAGRVLSFSGASAAPVESGDARGAALAAAEAKALCAELADRAAGVEERTLLLETRQESMAAEARSHAERHASRCGAVEERVRRVEERARLTDSVCAELSAELRSQSERFAERSGQVEQRLSNRVEELEGRVGVVEEAAAARAPPSTPVTISPPARPLSRTPTAGASAAFTQRVADVERRLAALERQPGGVAERAARVADEAKAVASAARAHAEEHADDAKVQLEALRQRAEQLEAKVRETAMQSAASQHDLRKQSFEITQVETPAVSFSRPSSPQRGGKASSGRKEGNQSMTSLVSIPSVARRHTAFDGGEDRRQVTALQHALEDRIESAASELRARVDLLSERAAAAEERAAALEHRSQGTSAEVRAVGERAAGRAATVEERVRRLDALLRQVVDDGHDLRAELGAQGERFAERVGAAAQRCASLEQRAGKLEERLPAAGSDTADAARPQGDSGVAQRAADLEQRTAKLEARPYFSDQRSARLLDSTSARVDALAGRVDEEMGALRAVAEELTQRLLDAERRSAPPSSDIAPDQFSDTHLTLHTFTTLPQFELPASTSVKPTVGPDGMLAVPPTGRRGSSASAAPLRSEAVPERVSQRASALEERVAKLEEAIRRAQSDLRGSVETAAEKAASTDELIRGLDAKWTAAHSGLSSQCYDLDGELRHLGMLVARVQDGSAAAVELVQPLVEWAGSGCLERLVLGGAAGVVAAEEQFARTEVGADEVSSRAAVAAAAAAAQASVRSSADAARTQQSTDRLAERVALVDERCDDCERATGAVADSVAEVDRRLRELGGSVCTLEERVREADGLSGRLEVCESNEEARRGRVAWLESEYNKVASGMRDLLGLLGDGARRDEWREEMGGRIDRLSAALAQVGRDVAVGAEAMEVGSQALAEVRGLRGEAERRRRGAVVMQLLRCTDARRRRSAWAALLAAAARHRRRRRIRRACRRLAASVPAFRRRVCFLHWLQAAQRGCGRRAALQARYAARRAAAALLLGGNRERAMRRCWAALERCRRRGRRRGAQRRRVRALVFALPHLRRRVCFDALRRYQQRAAMRRSGQAVPRLEALRQTVQELCGNVASVASQLSRVDADAAATGSALAVTKRRQRRLLSGLTHVLLVLTRARRRRRVYNLLLRRAARRRRRRREVVAVAAMARAAALRALSRRFRQWRSWVGADETPGRGRRRMRVMRRAASWLLLANKRRLLQQRYDAWRRWATQGDAAMLGMMTAIERLAEQQKAQSSDSSRIRQKLRCLQAAAVAAMAERKDRRRQRDAYRKLRAAADRRRRPTFPAVPEPPSPPASPRVGDLEERLFAALVGPVQQRVLDGVRPALIGELESALGAWQSETSRLQGEELSRRDRELTESVEKRLSEALSDGAIADRVRPVLAALDSARARRRKLRAAGVARWLAAATARRRASECWRRLLAHLREAKRNRASAIDWDEARRLLDRAAEVETLSQDLLRSRDGLSDDVGELMRRLAELEQTDALRAKQLAAALAEATQAAGRACAAERSATEGIERALEQIAALRRRSEAPSSSAMREELAADCRRRHDEVVAQLAAVNRALAEQQEQQRQLMESRSALEAALRRAEEAVRAVAASETTDAAAAAQLEARTVDLEQALALVQRHMQNTSSVVTKLIDRASAADQRIAALADRQPEHGLQVPPSVRGKTSPPRPRGLMVSVDSLRTPPFSATPPGAPTLPPPVSPSRSSPRPDEVPTVSPQRRRHRTAPAVAPDELEARLLGAGAPQPARGPHRRSWV